jgi:hypothetical protein
MLLNLVFAYLGNAVGAAVFVAGAYWYLYLKDAPVGVTPTDDASADGAVRQPPTVARPSTKQ